MVGVGQSISGLSVSGMSGAGISAAGGSAGVSGGSQFTEDPSSTSGIKALPKPSGQN